MHSNRNPRRLLAALMIATAGVAPALLLAPGAALAQQALRFDLPAQPLSAAVAGFGRISGWQVAYPAELGGVRTRAVSGQMPPAQALSAMLAGTGIQLRQTGPDSAALMRAPVAATTGTVPAGAVQLDQITLTGEAASGPFSGIIAQRSASGTKTDTPLIETPQTVNVIGREQMDQQGGSTVTDALRYTPGVVAGTNGGQSGRFDSYFVRGSGGFSAAANNANTMDGLRWRIPGRSGVQFDPWMVERVEVVKGPSSTLFGSGSPGGIVNLVSKRPEFQRHGAVFTAIGTHDRVETGIDYTGPLSDTLAYRVIGLARQGNTGIDFQRDERVLLAPSLTWAPTDRTSVILQALYQRDPHSPDAQFVPAYGSVLPIPGFGTVDPDFWQGDPGYQEFSRTQTALGWQIDHEFNDDWSLHSGLRWGKMHTRSKSMDFYSASGTTISRYAFLAEHATESTSTDNYVQGKFQTGAASHTLIAGVDYQKLSGRWESGADYNTGFSFYPIDMADPVYGIAINEPVLSGRIRQPFEQIGAYVQDQVALGNWRLLAGLRWDKIRTGQGRYSLQDVGAMTTSDNTQITWRLGGVYLFDNGYAPFVSYSTSFEPQLGITADGNPLKPSKGRMLEAGVRYLRPDNSLAFSATVFAGKNDRFAVSDTVNTDECAAVTGSPSGCQNDDNTKESRGLELEAKAQLDDGLDVIAGLTWQHVRLTESQGADADLHLVAVPTVTASVWVNYQAPEGKPLHGWTLGGGLRHIGSTYATDSNLWGASEGSYAGQKSKVPSFTLVDAAVGYDFGAMRPDLAGLRADLRVLNLFDRDYVAACNGYGSCSFGEGRTARLSLNYRW